MSNNSVHLHRVLRTTPEKALRAFTDAGAFCRWLPPFGYLGEVHHMEAKVGGTYRMSFRNFGTGSSHSFGGTYKEIIPGEKIVYTSKFEGPGLPGEMTTTVVLKKVMCGTSITITQADIPEAIPAEMCYLGWQESLQQLAQVVEPDIPDGA